MPATICVEISPVTTSGAVPASGAGDWPGHISIPSQVAAITAVIRKFIESAATLDQSSRAVKRFKKSGLAIRRVVWIVSLRKPEVKELGIRSSWFRPTHEAMNRPGSSGHENNNNVNT